jgi:hypothetical protein
MLATRKEAGNAKSCRRGEVSSDRLDAIRCPAETEGRHPKMCLNSPSTEEDGNVE